MTSNYLDDPFDTVNEEGSKFDLLPAGKYVAEIIDAVYGPTKSGRGQAVSLQWNITEGEFKNRRVFQQIMMEHENADARRIGRQRFKDAVTACGIKKDVKDLDVLRYRPCFISVRIRRDKHGEYDDKNEVRRISPVNGPAKAATTPELDDSIPF
jgi:hypothetical protein